MIKNNRRLNGTSIRVVTHDQEAMIKNVDIGNYEIECISMENATKIAAKIAAKTIAQG